MINLFQPEVQVVLHKTLQRKTTSGKDAVSERFAGAVGKRTIDLGPFLGAGSSVRVSKSVSGPAGGFQLVLVDRPYGDDGGLESLYGLVEPMDMIEIRARHAAPTDAGKPRILMRGFVSDVTRNETVDTASGQPQRQVVLSGQDYGKIWQILRISYHAGYLLGQSFISGFSLFEQYGVEAKTTMTSQEFVSQVTDKILNKFLGELMPENATLPSKIQQDVQVKTGAVSPAIQTQQGTIYELLRFFGDVGPWNELFTEDREDGVFLVYRPNPFADVATGKMIQADAKMPEVVDLQDEDVSTISVSRSDSDISNFFWVGAARFNLISEAYQKQEASASGDSTVILKDYANTKSSLYGLRLMEVQTQQGPADVQSFDSGGKSDAFGQIQANAVTWMAERRRILSESNKDNVVFERGVMRVRGNENLRAGIYVRLKRGDLTSLYYVVQVDHEYTPFQGYFTTLVVERGMGFVERVRQSKGPYMQELTSIK